MLDDMLRQRSEYQKAYRQSARGRAAQYKGRDKTCDARAFFWPGLRDALRDLQRGRCAICSVVMSTARRLSPTREVRDHCHVQLVPRGLLCQVCNVSLGNYEGHQRIAGLYIPAYERYLERPPAILVDLTVGLE